MRIQAGGTAAQIEAAVLDLRMLLIEPQRDLDLPLGCADLPVGSLSLAIRRMLSFQNRPRGRAEREQASDERLPVTEPLPER
jgi:hypothetical protein